MHTKTKGDITEVTLIAKLMRLGYVVLTPFGDNQRYDLVIENSDKQLLKVQCKTGKIIGGAVVFKTCSSLAHHRTGGRKSYVGEIDFFGVYCPDNDKCYLIPIGDCPDTEKRLRVDPSKNNQVSRTSEAKLYEV